MMRDGLAGRTVKLVLTEAKEEEPAFGGMAENPMAGSPAWVKERRFSAAKILSIQTFQNA
jgi:hypothetical protein